MDRLTSMSVFVAVARCGGFTAAAHELGLSPTMVGKHIQALEARVGAKLILRTTRRQGLTEVGAVFLERCRQTLELVEAADASADELRNRPRGRLRIGAPVTFGAHVVAPAMVSFLATVPEVELDLSLSDRLSDLIEDGVEAAFRIGAIGDQNLVAHPLAPYRMAICASPAYLDRHPAPLTPDDLIDHECLGFSPWAHPNSWRLLRNGVTHNVQVRGRFQINSGEALRRAALAGHGVIMQPLALLDGDIAEKRLIRLLVGYEPPSRPVNLVHFPDRRPTPKLRAFIDFATAHFV